ncbi:MAG: glycosyltransferase, partial [Candidatus Omnitrophica bacterium]|nr:glycosyltransferase [Candidatus Omnitrophota bacterium]
MVDNSKNIKLTIGIPTFNGSQSIRITLDSIVKQLEPGVEIVISDNGSIDDTAKIIREYQSRFPIIRYFSNNSNLEFDKNVDAVVRRANGSFVWLFADDDFMNEGAISHVLGVIKKYPGVAEIFVDSYKRCANLKEDYLCHNGDDFFAITKFRAGGLSGNVVNKFVWEETDLTNYIGSGWIHLGFLIVALSKYPSLICRDSFKSELK